jgi:hypothetical protein
MELTFAIAPAGPRPLYLLLPIALLIAGVFALLLYTGFGSQRARFAVTPENLAFRGDFYGRPVAWSAVRGAAARVVDLTREPQLRPVSRRFGTALPGYQAGWFRLADGERALLYVTDPRRVVYVPTTLGYAILLSPQDPERLLQEVRRRAPQG